MANNKYSNQQTNRVSTGGGAERLTIASTVAQGSDLPCRKVYVQATVGNTGLVRMNVGAAASTSLGIQIPEAEKANNGGGLMVEVHNVNELYFFGTDDDTIDIMYLR